MLIPLNVLLVEDNESDALQLLRVLKLGGYEVTHELVETAVTMRAALDSRTWDVVISDYSMPVFDGPGALALLRARDADLPFILVSGTVGEETAVAMVKAGASDYLMKNNLARLAPAVKRALHNAKLGQERGKAAAALRASELRYRRLFESAKDGILILDAESGKIVDVNPFLVDLLGTTREEIVGHMLWEISPFRDVASNKEAFRELQEKGQIRYDDLPLESMDGRRVDVEFVSNVYLVDETRVIQCNIRDISERKRAAQAVVAAERRYRSIFDNTSEGIIQVTPEGNVFGCNPAAADVLGYGAPEELIATIGDIGSQIYADAGSWSDLVEQIVAGRTVRAVEAGFRRGDGQVIAVAVSASFETDGVSGEQYLLVSFRDDTERKAQEQKIRGLNRVYSVLSGINGLIVRTLDKDELFRETCRIAVEVGNFVKAWVGVIDGDPPRFRIVAGHGADAASLQALEARLGDKVLRGEGIAGQALATKRAVVVNDIQSDPTLEARGPLFESGSRALVVLPLLIAGRSVGVLVLHAEGAGFFSAEELKLLTELAGDISFALDHIRKSDTVEHLAYFDGLTDLPNRRLFSDRLGQLLGAPHADSPHVAVIRLNINRFAIVNESLGRAAGDAVLRGLASRLSASFPEPGTVARVGGNKFAVAIPGYWTTTDILRAHELFSTQLFETPFLIADQELRISATVGIAISPGDGHEAEVLIVNAEAAVKRAKASGEKVMLYNAKMTASVGGALALENNLRIALKQGQFVLHYQPKVELYHRKIVGIEALLRWQSPELGLVPPLKFIPLMEETGLIVEVGLWVLRQAAKEHRAWTEAGLDPPRVAVNVSAVQLRRPDFVAMVAQAISEGLTPTSIDLEITESLLMDDIEGNVRKLHEIRALGMKIAIDDFGTGYSSLAYLSKLPVQTLKIDRAFISTMLDDGDDTTLVSTMIALAHSLRLTVVAEGVETDEQAKMLRLLRCDEMQGYLFSKPVPFEEMGALLLRARAPEAIQ
jgi:diguanylate cyclase (GGDEF)-like protein/PAS domain S-box-containing protein